MTSRDIAPTQQQPEPAVAEEEDRALLFRIARDGDEVAFGRLVDLYQDRLLGLCERLLGDRERALDAVQDVFLKVYRKAGSFEPRARVYTWLYRIATNHCLNKLRRGKILRFVRLGDGQDEAEGPREGPWPEPTDEGPDPHRSLEARQRWAATRRCIDSLPEGQKAVLVLAKFEGLSYRQIAAVLEITEGAVESRLVRAMRRLQKAQEVAP
jgi:RNA polymerase sigma-70 factor, ECF subfamily